MDVCLEVGASSDHAGLPKVEIGEIVAWCAGSDPQSFRADHSSYNAGSTSSLL